MKTVFFFLWWLAVFAFAFDIPQKARAEESVASKTRIRVIIKADNPAANPQITLDSPARSPYISEKIKDSDGVAIYLLTLKFTPQYETISFTSTFMCDGPENTSYVAWIRPLPGTLWRRLVPYPNDLSASFSCPGQSTGKEFTSGETGDNAFQIVVLAGAKSEIENTGFIGQEKKGVYTGLIKYFGAPPSGNQQLRFYSRNGACKNVVKYDPLGAPLPRFMTESFELSIEEEGATPVCEFYNNGGFYIKTQNGLSRLRYMGRGTLSSQYEAAFLSQEIALLKPLLPGDTNSDGKIDLKDLGVMKKNFNQACGPGVGCVLQGDLNGDFVVNLKDLGLLKQTFNKETQFKACVTPEDFQDAAFPGVGLPENGGCP